MRKILAILTLFFLTSCGAVNRSCASFSGHQKICVDGVEYIQFTSGASVSYDKNGQIKNCGNKE